MAQSEEELKSLLIRVKEESEKAVLKLSIQKTNVMASGPITSWQIGEEEGFYFLGLQNHCGWWLQPWNEKTLLGRKAMTNLGSVSKNRDLILPTKVCIVKALVFSVVMHRCEIWTIKKADIFKLWGWRRLLGVPWTAKRSNQSILKEINPEYSL